MRMMIPAGRHGRQLAREAAIRAALRSGLKVAEAGPEGRLHAVHLGAGDQLIREPIGAPPPARLTFDEWPP